MILRAEHLVKKYNRRPVVQDVSIQVRAGEVVGLLGPNGAGKTTSFFIIVGAIAPDGGQIFLDGEEITRQPMYVRARKGIGFLAQEPTVFRKMTAMENILCVLEVMKVEKRKRRERAFAALENLGIDHLAAQRADRLSGGETRRLEIARALVREPKFLLLDEPFAGIDPKAIEDIQSILADLRHRGIGLLITDHNVRETLSITDRSYILSEGRLLMSGTSKALAQDPEARRIYLGERFRLD